MTVTLKISLRIRVRFRVTVRVSVRVGVVKLTKIHGRTHECMESLQQISQTYRKITEGPADAQMVDR